MRVGDFGVDIVADGGGRLEERESGHVLARPGQVYRLRLRNFGPLYCVVEVNVDGRRVTAGGLVLEPWGSTELERPITDEDGRFTVVAEGDEAVFGPDGGRDNSALGLIEARFRRELPRTDRRTEPPPFLSFPSTPRQRTGHDVPRPPSRFPIEPAVTSSYHTVQPQTRSLTQQRDDAIERAAGTGLTGHSDQRFVPIELGPLETEATVIQLRLVIGTEAALAEEATRPLVDRVAPSRPAPRP
jgi:hypothetical protein